MHSHLSTSGSVDVDFLSARSLAKWARWIVNRSRLVRGNARERGGYEAKVSLDKGRLIALFTSTSRQTMVFVSQDGKLRSRLS